MSAAARAALEARGLVQRFGGTVALQGVDLELAAGERLAVVGDNGAGKTTLLRLLATASRPHAGELRIFGLDAIRLRESVRPRLGWLAHAPGLYPALTARENLAFFATLHGRPPERADECLALVGLESDAGRPASELSRGRQQRLAIARSLVHDPELWVLDEPDSSLDGSGRRLLGELAEGRSVVMSTHDRELASRLCSRALTLREGRVVPPNRLTLIEGSS